MQVSRVIPQPPSRIEIKVTCKWARGGAQAKNIYRVDIDLNFEICGFKNFLRNCKRSPCCRDMSL